MLETDKEKVRQYIAIYASEFIDNPNLDFMIEDQELSTSSIAFGNAWHKAIAFKTAHELQLASLSVSKKGNEVGVVIARSIGPVSIRYATDKSRRSDGTYNLTLYGKKYLELRDGHVCGIASTSYYEV